MRWLYGMKTDTRKLNRGNSFVDYKPAHSWWFAQEGVWWGSVSCRLFKGYVFLRAHLGQLDHALTGPPPRRCRFRPPYIFYSRGNGAHRVTISTSKRHGLRPILMPQKTYAGRERSELALVTERCPMRLCWDRDPTGHNGIDGSGIPNTRPR